MNLNLEQTKTIVLGLARDKMNRAGIAFTLEGLTTEDIAKQAIAIVLDSAPDPTKANGRSTTQDLQAVAEAGRADRETTTAVDTFRDPLPEVPAVMKAKRQWVRWRLETVNGKPTKVPYQVAGAKASSSDPNTWTDYQTALTGAVINREQGVGFMFADGFAGIDLDGCRNPKTGETKPWADDIIQSLDNVYVEVSPSGTGLHIFMLSKVPGADKKFNLNPEIGFGKAAIEIYDERRYFTVTGNSYFEEPGDVISCDLTAVYQMFHELRRDNPAPRNERAESADSATVGQPTKAKWHGILHCPKYDIFKRGEILSQSHPFVIDNGMGWLEYPSQSEADLAFCTILAIMHDGDANKIWDEYCDSAMVRDKWLDREDDFRRLTIAKAIESAKEFESRKQSMGETPTLTSTPNLEVREVVEPDTQPSPLVLPRSALTSSVFGDLYDQVFEPNDWPLELALPALATVGSVLVPQEQKVAGQLIDYPMTSLYTALIAPIHSGKSQVIEWAAKSVGIFDEVRAPHYTQVKFGSAEQMWKYLFKHSAGVSDTPTAFRRAVLVNPDEWAHVMAKAGIPDSTLASTLTTAFYNRRHTITLGGQGGGRDILIPFPFSIIGGIVEEDFDTVFDASSLGGLYDRFLFGLAPEGFKWSYRAFPYDHPFFQTTAKPVAVTAHPSLFEVIADWNKKDHTLGRVVEVCARVATIFASADGRSTVTGADLEKLAPLGQYQKAIRGLYRPNPGMNPDAIYANVAMGWIQTHARQWRTLRDLQKGTNYHRRKLGPNVAFRSVQALARDHQIDIWVSSLEPSGQLNPLPADYTGPRPKIGSALVRAAYD